MKINEATLSDLATEIVGGALNTGFASYPNPDPMDIEKVQIAARIKKAIADGDSHITFRIKRPTDKQ